MNLSDIFSFNPAGSQPGSAAPMDSMELGERLVQNVSRENTKALMDLVQLKPGQVFSGQVTDIGPDHVTIQSGGNSFTARFLEPVDLSISQQISFEVKENENDTITIAPVKEYFDSPEDALIYRALDKAGMAATDLNLDIGEALLKNGFTVDKQNIQKFAALSLKYPQASPEQLVLLEKHGVKINEFSIQHLNEYMEWSSKTTEHLSDISRALPEMLDELVKQEGKEEVKEFLNEHLSDMKESGKLEKPELSVLKELDRIVNEEKSTPENIRDFIKANEKDLSKAFTQMYSLEPEELEREGLDKFYKDLGKQMEQLNKLAQKFEAVRENTGEDRGSREPAQVQNNIINESAANKVFDGSGQVLSQMDFISQMNQGGFGGKNGENAQKMMAFLPLKLRNKVTQGDLYVYSRQHGKWDINEGISLYLNLQMETLGKLGVFMEMKQKYITMNFSLEDEESAKLIKQHLGELDEKLLKKGYRFSGSVGDLKNDKKDFVKDFLNKGERKQKVSRYSFDMRV